MPTRAAHPPATQAAPSSSDQTRAALIRAGLRLFGAKGFAGTSTRDIAGLANANIGSIAYHFGGKEGLRAACATHIVETIRAVAAQALGPDLTAPAPQAGPEAAAAILKAALERMINFVVARPEAGEIVQFIVRELSQPTAALDIIYDGVFEPTHRRLCDIWQQATGEPAESDRTKLTVFTLIGQVVYFRIAREPVLRRMGWTTIGKAEAAAVLDVAAANLNAILTDRKGRKP
ncbi:MAG: CerR family C-terminal domain-containing protein [Mesorhizobium sp.]